jgi:outer membrane protein
MLKASVAMVMLVAAPAFAKDVRVGVVDFNKIYTETETSKRDRAELDRLVAQRQAEVDRERQKVAGLQAELEKAKPTMDPVARAKQEASVDVEVAALKKLFEEAERAVNARERELSGRVVADAKELAPEIAKSHGLDLVLGATEALLWSAPSVVQVDLTGEVAHALDKLRTRQTSVLQRPAK